MKSHRYYWVAAAALGIASGLAIPKRPAPATSASKLERRSLGPRKSSAGHLPPAAAPATAASLPVSTDSPEDLLALDPTDLYGRLGLWLLDATVEEMSSFWDTYQKQGKTNMWIKDLIFTQWAKKDPHGLLEAAKRTGEEGPAWWAWAMSDPDAVLAASGDASESMRSYALRGIANFHPKRALVMLEEDPGMARYFDMHELSKHVGRRDPRAAVELLAGRQGYQLSKAFKRWAEEDPHRAFEWMAQNNGQLSLRKDFIEAAAKEHPEALNEIAAGLPAGAQRRELESAAFSSLARTDPDKAREEARTAGSPILKAERLAMVGKALITEHPEKALEVLDELLQGCPDATTRVRWTRYPDGGSGGGQGVKGVQDLLKDLTQWNPGLTMDSMLKAEQSAGDASNGRTTGSAAVAQTWAAKDLDGFAAWCDSQQDEARFNLGARIVSNQLREQEEYEKALGWAGRIADSNFKRSEMSHVMSQWASVDPAGARAWIESSGISEQDRKLFAPYFPAQSE